jgi:hypothetical protein
MNAWSKYSIIGLGIGPIIYDGGIDIPLKANLSRQLVQIMASILFFSLEYYIMKWQISALQPTNPSSEIVANRNVVPKNLQCYTNPYPKEFFLSQLIVTVIFFGLSNASFLILGHIPIENELLAIVGFAMTGFGSAVVYSGRELQRSFIRYARFFEEETPDNEASFRFYEYYDNIHGAAFF